MRSPDTGGSLVSYSPHLDIVAAMQGRSSFGLNKKEEKKIRSAYKRETPPVDYRSRDCGMNLCTFVSLSLLLFRINYKF